MAKNKAVSSTTDTPHNLFKGIWQLSRLHTFEGLSTASIGCIDICDRKVDGKVARTKKRPLPSGMITYPEAMVAFILGVFISVGVTYAILGEETTIAMIPAWVGSFIYPFAKRAIWAPQVILGLTMAACVLPPWVALGNDWTDKGLPTSLFGAIFCWLVYLDLIYASQDRPDDEKAGVKSLAVWLGDNLKLGLSVLGLAQIIFFTQAGFQASVSTFFWIFGIGVWAMSVPWSVLSLNLQDRHSGGRIFLGNAVLVLYLTAIAGGDVWTVSKLRL
ncbi:UbiA prenyltransferase family-domain-containing protein [Bisporella sp. PMI_857]|nr:UbiA prenyltransferase family-domain-containing protein [Bisporella sp. PMI_857]